MKNFVPDYFEIPLTLKSGPFRLEVLSPEVGEIDYDAVMSSKPRLRSVFGPATEWPRDDMTLEDNINDLERHKKEFDERFAFAYTVLNLTGEKCLGCVYIEPCKKKGYDCEIYSWIRESHLYLDPELYQTVKIWVESEWPFRNISFPGREISWEDWNKLK